MAFSSIQIPSMSLMTWQELETPASLFLPMSSCHLDIGVIGVYIMTWRKTILDTVIPSPHLLVLVTSERFLPTWGTFRTILASESHWLQPVLVLSVHWWPTPVDVGRVLFVK